MPKPLTVQNIIRNATAARNIARDIEFVEDFEKFFHLRPTNSGVTVISTLPYAAMRGKVIPSKSIQEQLPLLLNNLNNSIRTLNGTDIERAKARLNECGFAARKTESLREEDIQALFIVGMLRGEPQFEGIEFVASELTLGDNQRLDVVGIKNDTLYIFELKKDRTLAVVEQTADYVELITQYKEDFLSVLNVYPLRSVNSFCNVTGVAVMKYSYNLDRNIRELARNRNINVWYYTHALGFDK